MPRQFNIPDDVIKDVCRGASPVSTYASYMESIQKEHIIGINNAYQLGDWVDAVFFGDCGWWLTHQKSLANYHGLKITCCPRFGNKPKEDCDGVKFLMKDSKKPQGITENSSKISWNSNSGAAAVSLAYHFGVSRIILLGFDMNIGPDQKTHWHGQHGPAALNRKGQEKVKRSFGRHLKGFSVIAEDARRLGLEIINANPDSAIPDFPKLALGALL